VCSSDLIVEVEYADAGRERYVLPLAMSSDRETRTLEETNPGALLARITGARKGAIYDGLFDDGTCQTLLASIQEERTMQMRRGAFQADNIDLTPQRAPADTLAPITRSAPDQSNTSVLFGKKLILKMFRRVEGGPNPDVEIGEYLTERRFARVPPLVGSISYLPGPKGPGLPIMNSSEAGRVPSEAGRVPSEAGRVPSEAGRVPSEVGRVLSDPPDLPASIAMLQEYVWNQGNGWQVTIDELDRYLERVASLSLPADATPDAANAWACGRTAEPPASVTEAIRAYLATADILGRRTGELHVALADNSRNPAFAPEPLTNDELTRMIDAMRRRGEEHLKLLEAVLPQLDERAQAEARQVLDQRAALLHQFEELRGIGGSFARIRCHGDYHLGQVLVTEGDVAILDFEGEPARPLAERRAKDSPLRDVGGMLRSFSYAALTAIGAATETRPEDAKRLAPWAELWETWVSAAFLRAYLAATRGAAFLPPPPDLELLLRAYVLDKALYELAYELNNRPACVHIPLAGIMQLRAKTTA